MTLAAPTEPLTYSIPEFARLLGVSRGYAYNLAKDTGEVAGCAVIRVGGRLLISRSQADRVLAGDLAGVEK